MRLALDPELVDEAFDLADAIAAPVVDFATAHTTVAIERTVARLCGVDGVDDLGVPLPNVLVDALGPRLGEGIALTLAAGLPRPRRARPSRSPRRSPAGPSCRRRGRRRRPSRRAWPRRPMSGSCGSGRAARR